ncbi:kinetochore-Ndc80 subunit Spc24 [Entophlyctis helioformis]|nr:kinetochore-Ndc80 subunit Spc24 [Entophlyctis helioformis]
MLQLDRTKYATARAVSDLQSSLEAAETKLKALETEIDAVKAAEASAKEQEMDVPMMRLALYLGIGVEFFKDEATGEYNQILAKSPARNDMELIDIEKQYSQFYYTNLCWDLCDDLVLV